MDLFNSETACSDAALDALAADLRARGVLSKQVQLRRVRGSATRFPLASAQESLWLLQALHPQSCALNILEGLRIRGSLDPAAFSAAVDAVVERNEILYTTYGLDAQGGAYQVIGAPAPKGIVRSIDVADLSSDAAEPVWRRYALEMVSEPFDLQVGPMLRACLIRLDADHHVLLMSFHQVAVDGWSVTLLIQQLGDAYEALVTGRRPAPRAPSDLRFVDYACWERLTTRLTDLSGRLQEWERDLANRPPRRRVSAPAAGANDLGNVVYGAIPASIEVIARRLALKSRTSIYMLLLAAFATVLFAKTGERDLVIGTDTANRNSVELESLVGFLVNQVPLRVTLSVDETFEDFLRRVRRLVLESCVTRAVPFTQLLRRLQPERDAHPGPLFNVKLVMRRPSALPSIAGLAFERLPTPIGSAQFDLTMIIADGGSELSYAIEYNSSVTSEHEARAIGLAMERVLSEAVSAPIRTIGELADVAELAEGALEGGLDRMLDQKSSHFRSLLQNGQVQEGPR